MYQGCHSTISSTSTAKFPSHKNDSKIAAMTISIKNATFNIRVDAQCRIFNVILSVMMLSDIILRVVMLSVVRPVVVRPSVVAP